MLNTHPLGKLFREYPLTLSTMTATKPSDEPSGVDKRRRVPQPHGGALVPGAGGGPQPGSGRPKNEAREKLAKIVNDHGVDYVRRVLTGEEDGVTVQNRLDAFEKAAKFGIGALKGVDEEDVRGRLRLTLEIITAEIPADAAEALLGKIEKVWR